MQTAITFTHETLNMDGESYSDCEFRDCRLIFAGGVPPEFNQCRFNNCDWRLEGAAANTLESLKVIWGVGGKAVVQLLIKEITGGGGR